MLFPVGTGMRQCHVSSASARVCDMDTSVNANEQAMVRMTNLEAWLDLMKTTFVDRLT
jgi:hypothetical protein